MSFGKFLKITENDNAIFQPRKVLERRSFSKCLWKCFGFLFGKFYNILERIYIRVVLNIVCVMFVHFTIYNAKHNPPKSHKNGTEAMFFMGFQNANENVHQGFGNLVIWLCKSFGKFWKYVSSSL